MTDEMRFDPASYEGKPRSISKQHRKILRSFSEPMFERLKGMSQKELADFIEACRSVSPANCGWDQYAVAKMLYDSAVWHLGEKTEVIEGGKADAA